MRPRQKGQKVAAILKATQAQEDHQARLQKAQLEFEKMKAMKLLGAARTVEDVIAEIFNYAEFPREHWRDIRIKNPMEGVVREIRRRTRVGCNFPGDNSALMLVTVLLRYVAGRKWGTRKYMNMQLLRGGATIQEAREA
jgi:transposase-like protein